MIKDITKSKQAHGLLALLHESHKGRHKTYKSYFIQTQQTTLSITSFFSEDHGTPSNKMADCRIQSAICFVLKCYFLDYYLLDDFEIF